MVSQDAAVRPEGLPTRGSIGRYGRTISIVLTSPAVFVIVWLFLGWLLSGQSDGISAADYALTANLDQVLALSIGILAAAATVVIQWVSLSLKSTQHQSKG